MEDREKISVNDERFEADMSDINSEGNFKGTDKTTKQVRSKYVKWMSRYLGKALIISAAIHATPLGVEFSKGKAFSDRENAMATVTASNSSNISPSKRDDKGSGSLLVKSVVDVKHDQIQKMIAKDKKDVASRNEGRIKLAESRRSDYKSFKDAYLREPHLTIDFILKDEYFSSGIEDAVYKSAIDNFYGIVHRLPQNSSLEELLSVLSPEGSYNRTFSNALDSLAKNLGPESQNCEARMKLYAAVLLFYYPTLEDKIMVQEFGDHLRLIVETGEGSGNGEVKRVIMEGNRPEYPDFITKKKTNVVMPIKEYYAFKYGVKFADLKNVVINKGESAELYERVTDNFSITPDLPVKLGNYSNADDFYRAQFQGVNTNGFFLSDFFYQGQYEPLKDDGDYIVKTTLDETEAKRNITSKDWHNISVYTEITAEGARYAVESGGAPDGVLYLNSIRNLTPEIAKELIKFNGLKILGIKEISLETLSVILESGVADTFIFPSFSEITLEQAKLMSNYSRIPNFDDYLFSKPRISSYQGEGVKISEESLSLLIKSTDIIVLNSSTLSDNSLKLLAESNKTIVLNGLEKITDRQADFLSKHKDSLYLDGVRELSDKQVELLSKHTGVLSLNGLTSITDKQAELFSEYQGRLYLDGITSLSDRQTELLSKHSGGLSLNGINNLTDKQIDFFSKYQGVLSFAGLTKLSDTQVELFSKYNFRLMLNGLKILTDKQAWYFANHKGDLKLNGITTLTDKQAEYFSKHKGFLRLDGITSLTDKQAEYLSHHVGGLNLANLNGLTDKQLQFFELNKTDVQLRWIYNGAVKLYDSKKNGNN